MTPFIDLQAIAAFVPEANIDTDKLVPSRFLKAISRQGLGSALFADMRRNPDFVLNHAPWDRSGILISLDNFGCGSSREHAPWALVDFGIRCVITPGFADIFHQNCLKNGILPVVLPTKEIEALGCIVSDPETATLKVDLLAQTIMTFHGMEIGFDIEGDRKARLLAGTDDISESLQREETISAFEVQHDALPACALPDSVRALA